MFGNKLSGENDILGKFLNKKTNPKILRSVFARGLAHSR